MTKAWLQVNSMRYSFEELKSGLYQNRPGTFEHETLSFCRDWLRGRKSFVFSTSGSTGKPKKIVLKRSQLTASARNTIRAFDLRRGDTALLCLDPRYIAGRMMLVRSLIAGMNIVAVAPSSNPFTGLREKIDFVALVPYQLQTILRSVSTRQKLNRLKAVIIGGAETDSRTRAQIARLKAPVYATYGMTETISHIALQKLNAPGAHDYFHALPGIQIGQDKRQCLTIRAAYLGRKLIVTNDIVEMHSSKKFRWLGRWDNIINTGGVKVIPEKIEKAVAVIFETKKIHNLFFVTGLPDNTLGSKVTLVVEGRLSPVQRADVTNYLSSALTRFEMPRQIIFVAHFTETATNKINRGETLKGL